MRLACCQLDIAWEEKTANYRRVEALIGVAALPPGALLLLPEMFATGFTMNAAAVAEPMDGPTASFLSDLAGRHKIFVQAGMVVQEAGDARPRTRPSCSIPRAGCWLATPRCTCFRLPAKQRITRPASRQWSLAGKRPSWRRRSAMTCVFPSCFGGQLKIKPRSFRSSPAGRLPGRSTGWPCCVPGRSRINAS